MKKALNILPGFFIALCIAFIAQWIEKLLPIHLIGSSVIALFIGMIINNFWKPAFLTPGLKFTSKKVLKFAIILLGASLSIGTILNIGKLSLVVMIFTLLTCFPCTCNHQQFRLMVSALAAIGLNTSFKEMSKSGPMPMLHGFVISALVVIVAIAVEFCMGIV